MLRRLFLFLLLLGLALPAVALTAHCPVANAAPVAPVANGHHPGHHSEGSGKPTPAKTAATKDCIGCVTPPIDARPRTKAPLPRPERHRLTDDVALARAAPGPETPPPRA